jgi:hypothetical protein
MTTADYSVEIVAANTLAPLNPAITSAPMDISIAAAAPTDVVVKVYTDNYPTEITWNIKNSAGAIVASGGPYVGSANGGGADANTTKIHNVALAANDCYSINLLDSYGDGWSYGTTAHGVEVFDNANNSIWNVAVGGFGTSLANPNSLNTAALANETFNAKQFDVFPNPTTGIIHINSDVAVSVSIVDVTGKVVFTANNITKENSINLSGLQKGMYLAKISTANATTTEKIILN